MLVKEFINTNLVLDQRLLILFLAVFFMRGSVDPLIKKIKQKLVYVDPLLKIKQKLASVDLLFNKNKAKTSICGPLIKNKAKTNTKMKLI